MAVTQRTFGATKAGETVLEFVLANAGGTIAKILSFGGIIRELHIADREGAIEDVVLGFDSLAQYEGEHPYFGALIGRVANRIGGAAFTLDGKSYTLAANNGKNTLHGGIVGFDKKVWTGATFDEGTQCGVRLNYLSPDGEEGFPGSLKVQVTYILTDANELVIKYSATTDAPTIVNLTSHSYFNFSLPKSRPVLDHELVLNSDHYTVPSADLILPVRFDLPLAHLWIFSSHTDWEREFKVWKGGMITIL